MNGYEQLARCTGFEWDPGNSAKVSSRHDVSPGECEQVFFTQPLIVAFDEKHAEQEPRWQVLGQTAAKRRVHLVFTIRGSLIRVIAARDMNRKERRLYEERSPAETGPEV